MEATREKKIGYQPRKGCRFSSISSRLFINDIKSRNNNNIFKVVKGNN